MVDYLGLKSLKLENKAWCLFPFLIIYWSPALVRIFDALQPSYEEDSLPFDICFYAMDKTMTRIWQGIFCKKFGLKLDLAGAAMDTRSMTYLSYDTYLGSMMHTIGLDSSLHTFGGFCDLSFYCRLHVTVECMAQKIHTACFNIFVHVLWGLAFLGFSWRGGGLCWCKVSPSCKPVFLFSFLLSYESVANDIKGSWQLKVP